MPGIASARTGGRASSSSAPPLLPPGGGPSAVHPPAESHIEGEHHPMSTMAFRTPDKDVLEAEARLERTFHCSWCIPVRGCRQVRGISPRRGVFAHFAQQKKLAARLIAPRPVGFNFVGPILSPAVTPAAPATAAAAAAAAISTTAATASFGLGTSLIDGQRSAVVLGPI
jgi:hypothetical protein